jgi:hypothetical protein
MISEFKESVLCKGIHRIYQSGKQTRWLTAFVLSHKQPVQTTGMFMTHHGGHVGILIHNKSLDQ